MRSIVISTDFSRTTATALRVAAHLAGNTGLGLEVVHFYAGFGGSDEFLARRGDLTAQSQAQRNLEEFIRFNTSAGQDDKFGPFTPDVLERLTMRTLIGDPASGLMAISKESNTEMIIMGAVGASLKKDGKFFYGSVAKKVSFYVSQSLDPSGSI